jgi:hypothetical protein
MLNGSDENEALFPTFRKIDSIFGHQYEAYHTFLKNVLTSLRELLFVPILLKAFVVSVGTFSSCPES